MIVRPRPHPWQLLTIVRGSIIPKIALRVLTITALSCLVVALHRAGLVSGFRSGTAPFSILAIALSVFLGFRNNACYERWWEGRKQWGELILQSRAFARECLAVLPAHAAALNVHATIGYAHALAARLRGQHGWEATRAWLESGELAGRDNLPDAILHTINQNIAQSRHQGAIGEVIYQGLMLHLHALTAVQAACERIRNTPLPFAYSLLLHRTAWLFCLLLPFGLVDSLGLMTPAVVSIIAYTFFGLDELGDELEEPFGLAANDLPLSAMVRMIEIDLLSVLGEQDLPAPLLPEAFVLL